MDTTTHHTMEDLFAQLGLPHEPGEIRDFIRRHRPLPDAMRLADAPIWTDAQAMFLKEQWRADDGDWAIVIDELNVRLRQPLAPDELPRAEGEGDDAPVNEGEGNVTAARRYNQATQEFVATHDVPDATRSRK